MSLHKRGQVRPNFIQARASTPIMKIYGKGKICLE